MTVREKRLLNILIILIIICTFFITIQNSVLNIKENKQSIENYKNRIEALDNKAQANNMNAQINKKSVPYYAASSEVIETILKDLKSSSIIPLRYQILKYNEGEFLEVSIKCKSLQFTDYLKETRKSKLQYTIKNINVKTENEELSVTLNYSFVPSKVLGNELTNEYPVEKLFRPLPKKNIIKKTEANTTKQSDDIKNGNSEYRIIGRIKESDGIHYLYLKTNETNRVMKITPDNILSEDSEKYIVIIDGKKYSIQKGE